MRCPTTPPPGKLSDLIDLAVADARRLDRTTYTPDSSVWHEPADDDCCMICLAGSVIAETLKCPRDQKVELGDEDNPDPDRVKSTTRKMAAGALSARQRPARLLERGLTRPCAHPTHPRQQTTSSVNFDQRRVPEHPKFKNWTEFDAHLESLTTCANKLRKLGL